MNIQIIPYIISKIINYRYSFDYYRSCKHSITLGEIQPI